MNWHPLRNWPEIAVGRRHGDDCKLSRNPGTTLPKNLRRYPSSHSGLTFCRNFEATSESCALGTRSILNAFGDVTVRGSSVAKDGLCAHTTGGIILAGREIDGAGPDRGVVFQSPSLLPWLTAFQNVLLGVEQVRGEATRREKNAIVEHYLSLVGLADAMHRRPSELSQGMRQRVGLARAFALNPKMLLLDEPFGMLDALTRYELQEVLMDLWAQDQKTALMVTHDVDEALLLSDRVVMMTNGPEARVGDILQVTFPRPRRRTEVMRHSDYYRLREHLIGFLESQEQHGESEDASENAPETTSTRAKTPVIEPSVEDSTSRSEPLLAAG